MVTKERVQRSDCLYSRNFAWKPPTEGGAEDIDPLHLRNVSAVLDVLVGLDGVSAAQVVYDQYFLAQAS